MTRINRLVMNGFKSFAKFTELVFGEKYNCVLGPNGSGKSNVLDALCFVLGKTSAKSLRAEKSSNLIYNGGKTKKPAAKAEVSIYFDNKDKLFPTEETEVKVTRIIRPNGQSIYKINDQMRTRQQVVDLLNIARIDPDGYNIILQGDIIRFCEMSTIERRLLIEEISGISMYEEKKQKALLQLQKVEERLKEAEIILAERKTYLNELKKDRDQALKFKEMNDNIRKYKASLLKLNIDKKEAELAELKEKIDKNTAFIQDCTEKIKKFREEIERKKAEIEAITKEIEEKGETDQVNLNREIENLKIEMTKKNSRTDTLNSELKKISQKKQDLNKGIEEISNKVAALTAEKTSLNGNRQENEKEKDAILKKIQQFRQKNNLEQAADIEKRIDEIDKLSEELAKEINFMRETQHNLLRKKDSLDHDISTVASAISKVAEIEKENKKQLDDLKSKRDEFKKTALELNKLLDEDSNLAAQTKDKREESHLLAEDLAKLNAREAQIKEFSHSDMAIKSILEKKKSTPGIYGTVSELGVVDAKYSLALEVAAGSRLRSIVVEDDKIAAEQIKLLRQNKLGIATFLPLNKIKPKELDASAKKLLDAKGCQGIASDLVKYDPKFRKVFQYVFGGTLIVDNIDVARRLGIGAAKMVTLDGDLADVSGSMKGGFYDRKRKGMGFKEAELDREILEKSRKISLFESALSSFESRRKDIDEKITALRSKKAELEGEIIKSEKSLHLDSSDLALSKKRQEELAAEAKSLEKDINAIQDKILDKNRELAKLKIEKQQARGKISELRDPALVAELSTYEEKQRQLSEEIIRLASEIKNIEIQIKDIFEPEIAKTNNILKQNAKDELSFKEEISKLSKETSELAKLLKKKEEEAKAFYSKFKELFNLRSRSNDDINKAESKINEINDKYREVEIKNNLFSIKNAEISGELAGLRQDFSQYEGVQLDTEKTEDQLKYQVQRFEKMKDEIGSVNMRALEIYEEIEKEYNKLIEKKDILSKEKLDVEAMMAEIESRKKELFMKTYDSINTQFQKIFLSLSKKGDASLEIENKEDPFAEGVGIKVRITGQRFLDIRSLSGGEKTMTALAFIFSIQEHEPASFYILDEVDAALDKHNSEKLSKLIRVYAERAQYIMISHNDAVISEADILYGVSMDEHGISKVVSLKV